MWENLTKWYFYSKQNHLLKQPLFKALSPYLRQNALMSLSINQTLFLCHILGDFYNSVRAVIHPLLKFSFGYGSCWAKNEILYRKLREWKKCYSLLLGNKRLQIMDIIFSTYTLDVYKILVRSSSWGFLLGIRVSKAAANQ